MKFLQDLVPGCDKVTFFLRPLESLYCLRSAGSKSKEILGNFQITGKAVMLDEIINYVLSLQKQVEVCL